MEVEGPAVVGDQLEAAEVGELLRVERHPRLLRQLAYGTCDSLLVTLEAASGEAPHLRPHRSVLVALLHQDPATRVDEGHLDEVGADGPRAPLQHAVERERRGLVELAPLQCVRVDEHHLPPLAADHVVVGDRQAHGEQLELVVLAARLAAEASHPEGLQPIGSDRQAGLLGELAHRGRDEVLTVLEVAARVAPPPRVVECVVPALLQQQSAPGVEDCDRREPVHPATLEGRWDSWCPAPHIRTR